MMTEMSNSAVFSPLMTVYYGAGRRSPALGLGRVDIVLPSRDDLGAVGERMSHYRVPVRDDGQTLAFEDPWANAIRLTTSAP